MNQLNLTEGRVWKMLARYSIPMVISSLLQAAYSMADLIIAGNFIGSAGISAINNSSQIMNLCTQIIIGLTTGGNILLSQYYGADDHQNRKIGNSTLLASSLLGGAIFTAVLLGFSVPLLSFLKAPAMEEATDYLRICAFGAIPIFGYNALSASIRSVGNSKLPLYCIAVTASMNIILDLVFVGSFHMGAAGAALATVISQAASFVFALYFVLRDKELYGVSLFKLTINGKMFRHMLKLGFPCAIQMSMAGISWLSVTFIVNQYGVHVSAGNGISVKIKDFCQLFIVAMANAAATMVAQNLGAGKFDRARQVTYTAMRITIGMALVLIAVVELFAPFLVGIFTSDPEDSAAAVANLRIEIIGQVFYASFLVYHSLAIGAGHTWFALLSSFVNCIMVRLPLAFLLDSQMGITGLYFACMIAPASSVPVGLIYERSGIWKRRIV